MRTIPPRLSMILTITIFAGTGRASELDASRLDDHTVLPSRKGATARPLKERFADTVNVKDFGANGTGKPADAASNTAAFAGAMLAAAGNGVVEVPEGWYFINDTIVMGEYVSALVGAGGGRSTIVWAGPSTSRKPMIRMSASGQTIRDISINGNHRAASIGILMQHGAEGFLSHIKLDNVRVEACVTGVKLATGPAQHELFRFDNVVFHNNHYGIHIEANQADYWTFTSCEFAYNDVGLYSTGYSPNMATFVGCTFTGTSAAQVGVQITRGFQWGTIAFINCQSEGGRYIDHTGLGNYYFVGGAAGGITLRGMAGQIISVGTHWSASAGAPAILLPVGAGADSVYWRSMADRFSYQGRLEDFTVWRSHAVVDNGGIVAADVGDRYENRFAWPITVAPSGSFAWRGLASLTVRAAKGETRQPILRLLSDGDAPVLEVDPDGALRTGGSGYLTLKSVMAKDDSGLEVVPNKTFGGASTFRLWTSDDETNSSYLRATASSHLAVLESGRTGIAPPIDLVFRVLGTERLRLSASGIGFNGSLPITKVSVTGSRSDGTALASLVGALAKLGLISDATTP